MARPYIKTVTGAVSVPSGGTVPLGQTLVMGYCRQSLYLLGNSVNVADRCVNGYKVSVNATFTAPVAGDVTLNVLQNGTAVPGGTATKTVATAATVTQSISFSTIIRSSCGVCADALTLANVGVAADMVNVEFDVERL